MGLLRALRYFLEEALTSLWRSRLINVLSIGTMGVSLFVLGAFLTTAANIDAIVSRWARRVQVTFYLHDGADGSDLAWRLEADAGVESVARVSREEALERFRRMFRDLRSLPEDLAENPFPASVEATLRPGPRAPEEVERVARAYGGTPGVEEVQYDLLWVQRLTTAVRLVRGVGAFLGGILVLAGVFTISNVLRLTVYARQDELDIMRLVGATPAYVKGPFVMEGMIQGGLGGLLAVGLLWAAFRAFVVRTLAGSGLLSRTDVFLPSELCAALVAGGMLVGVVGSVVSLGRSRV